MRKMYFVNLHIPNSLEELQGLAWCPLSPSHRPKVLLAPICRIKMFLQEIGQSMSNASSELKNVSCTKESSLWRNYFISEPNCLFVLWVNHYQLWNPTQLYYLWNHHHCVLMHWLNSDPSEAGDYRPVLTSDTMKTFKRLILYIRGPQTCSCEG